MRCSCRKKYKNNKIPNEQPAFRCQPAFGSHSQLLTNKLFSSFFFISLSCASHAHDEKGTFYSFLNVFDHFRPCECMRKHVFAGRNTQQVKNPHIKDFFSLFFFYFLFLSFHSFWFYLFSLFYFLSFYFLSFLIFFYPFFISPLQPFFFPLF